MPNHLAFLSGRILIALVIWSFYVVVGRACAPLIQRHSSTGLGRGTGSKPMQWILLTDSRRDDRFCPPLPHLCLELRQGMLFLAALC